MLTQTSDPTGVLLGCGVDAEAIDRFETIPTTERAWHLVFTEAELAHCHALPRPALGLCAAFCCKESLCKALPTPYNFTDCELYLDPFRGAQDLVISASILHDFGIERVTARIDGPHNGEMIAAVFTFGGRPT